MTTITDADREAAASIAVLPEMRELILAGRADHHAEPFARYREAALEDAAKVAEHIASCAFGEGMSEYVVCARYYTAYDIATAIRALKGNNDAG